MTERGFLNHIWYKLLDEEGVPVSGGNVYIYEASNPTTQILIYESDGLTQITQPIVTSSTGIFDFFVHDDIGVPSGIAPSASGHYPWETKYLISWSKDDKSGILSGDSLFGEYDQVDETDTNTRVNKALSNYLGWIIQDHVDFQFGTTQNCGSSSSSSSSTSISSSSMSAS